MSLISSSSVLARTTSQTDRQTDLRTDVVKTILSSPGADNERRLLATTAHLFAENCYNNDYIQNIYFGFYDAIIT